MAIKEGDFVEIEYIGKIKFTGKVFDTNIEKVAKENNIYEPNKKFQPTIVCVGKNDVVKGLDKFLAGKEVGKEYTVEIKPEDGFGAYDKKSLKIMSINEFKNNDIMPFPGLVIDFGGLPGTITSVNGGRVMVDFNHPLAGKILEYQVKINKLVTDTKTKIESCLKLMLNKAPEVVVEKDKAIIKAENLPKNFSDIIKKVIKERVPEIKHVEFVKKTVDKFKNRK